MPSSLTRVLSRALEFSSCPPVSVCGTGTINLASGFSWQLVRRLRLNWLHITSDSYDTRDLPPVSYPQLIHAPPVACSPPSLRPHFAQTINSGIGISTDYPSPTPFGLSLGPGLPWADEPSPGNLGLPAEGILTPLIVTHTGILTSVPSTAPSGTASPSTERSPTNQR